MFGANISQLLAVGSDLRWIDSEIARFKGHIGLKS